jgi:RsiW-degrading membrane proteinase PrsW (M82 family)
MAFCGMCAASIADTAKFCARCGAATGRAAGSPAAFTAPVAVAAAVTAMPTGPTAAATPRPPSTWAAAPTGTTGPTLDARAVAGAVQSLVGEFQQLPIRTLVPLRAWWQARVWQQPWAALFLIAAVTPFVLLHLGGGDAQNFHQVAWGFSIYFAFIWFIALFVLVRPDQLDWPLLGKVAVFTAVLGVAIALFLEKHLASGEMNVVKYVLGVGVPEEIAKAAAVYVFVYRARQVATMRTFLFVGAVSGLAFGAAEAVSYSTAFAESLPFVDNAGAAVTTEIWRLLTDSLFHACLAGISGFFFGLARIHQSYRVGLIGFGLAFTGLLHGLYDNFAEGWTGAALAIAIIVIFVGYVASTDQIAADFHAHATTAQAAPGSAPAQPWQHRSWLPEPAPSPAVADGPAEQNQAASGPAASA